MDNNPMASDSSTLFRNYYELIAEHGNLTKHYKIALKQNKNELVELIRKSLFVIEGKIQKLSALYIQCEIDNALKTHMKDTGSPATESIAGDSPSSPESNGTTSEYATNGGGQESACPSPTVSNIGFNDNRDDMDPAEIEQNKKDKFLAYFGLIHVDKIQELQQNRKVYRKCRANANSQYSREALEERHKLAEIRKNHSKILKEMRANDKKKKAKHLVFNYSGMISQKSKKVFKFDEDVQMVAGFKKVRTLQLDTFSCFICREALNRRDRRVVLACDDCKTFYHQKCIAPNDDLSNIACHVCDDIVQRRRNHKEAIVNCDSFKEVVDLSFDIVKKSNFHSALTRSMRH